MEDTIGSFGTIASEEKSSVASVSDGGFKKINFFKTKGSGTALSSESRSGFPKQIFLNEEYYKKYSNSQALGENSFEPEISRYVEVVFHNKKKEIYLNKRSLPLVKFQYVLAEVEGGIDIATVLSLGEIAEKKLKTNYGGSHKEFSVVKQARIDDMRRYRKNLDEAPYVIQKTKEFVRARKLDMKITDAEWQFDRQRLTIYFIAPQRIDFRELVKDLARTFRTRIELRQISTREEAKKIGGMGPCGRPLCCATFACQNCRVTLDHARAQQLSNNVAKLSGYCGRLKCCLLYEFEYYEEELKKYPPLNSELELKEGVGKILKTDIFKKSVYVYIQEARAYKTVSYEELQALSKAGKIRDARGEEDAVKDLRKMLIDPDEDNIESLKSLEGD